MELLTFVGVAFFCVYVCAFSWLFTDANERKQPLTPWLCAYLFCPGLVLIAYLVLVLKPAQAKS
jgi:hypothetical protein